jgi:hypothetical protein
MYFGDLALPRAAADAEATEREVARLGAAVCALVNLNPHDHH